MSIMTHNGHRAGVRGRALIAALLGCSAIVTVGATGARAQATNDDVIVLDTIVLQGDGDGTADGSFVTLQSGGAGRLETPFLDSSASVSVITEAEIQERGASSVEEVLQYSAAVFTDQYGADNRYDYYMIRGFDAYAYRDGLSLGTPFGGVREETYAFDQVEVLKGANSTAYGVSDPGGSVNYRTKLPKSERFAESYVTAGSFDRAEVGVDFGDNLTKDDTLSYRVTAKVSKGELEYDESRDDEKFFMGGLTWRPSDATSVSVVVDVLDIDSTPGSGGFPEGGDFDRSEYFGEPDFNYLTTDRTSTTVMLDHDFGGGLSLNSSLRYSDIEQTFGYVYVSSTPTTGTIAGRSAFTQDSSGQSVIGDAHLQYDGYFDKIDSRSVVGVEYSKSTADEVLGFDSATSIDWTNPVYTGAPDSVATYSDTLTEQRGHAIYAEQELTFAGKYVASAGVRHDWLDTKVVDNLYGTTSRADISETTARAGLTYKATNELSVYGSYAQSVVPASVGLEPERGEQYELGVKYAPLASRATFSAAIYDLTKNNITQTDPVTYVESTIGEVRVRGLDLEAKAELTPNVSLTAAYSYMDSKIIEDDDDSTEGNNLSFVPEHLASLWVHYLFEGEGNRGDQTVGLGLRYIGSYYYDDANTESTGAHTLVDASYSYQINDQTKLALNVTNLLDEKYVAYGGFGSDFYNEGREFTATLSHSW
ncbi:TonB-dependent siderophore receptor [Paracoccus sp. JM45]|uniref:TonB-dependent siderophore receptor n=1 Tax=Paracoccus sp. JM45 TaxID=2283626 RepID=UPI000E6C5746|nr:TonB-dependent siderophore receptor [Paracoccus sp. JM45]RJE79008.1 TonB-dependent siderophore receptor [Paracoccus sp. JM45]